MGCSVDLIYYTPILHSLASGSGVHAIELGLAEFEFVGNEARSGEGGLGDPLVRVRFCVGEDVIQLMREDAGQSAAEEHVGAPVISAPHGCAQRGPHAIARDLAEWKQSAVCAVRECERAGLAGEIGDRLHTA